MLKFSEEFELKTYQCNQFGSMKLKTLFDYFQELAGDHADKLGLGYEECISKNCAWVCSKYHVIIDKMRILEFLAIFGESCVSDISKGVNIEQMKLSQYLKRLKDDGFVVSRRDGRHIYYDITTGIHKTIIKCMHNKFEKKIFD